MGGEKLSPASFKKKRTGIIKGTQSATMRTAAMKETEMEWEAPGSNELSVER